MEKPHSYNIVSGSPFEDRQSGERLSSDLGTDDSRDQLLPQHGGPRPSYERQYRKLRLGMTVLSLVLALVSSYTVYLYIHTGGPRWNAVPFGADPFGYVPVDIGEPPRWTTFGPSDEYYVPYDTFDSLEKVIEMRDKLYKLEHAGILSHGKNTTYHSTVDGKVHDLRPTIAYQGDDQFPVYFITAFHQMHCIAIITDEYGHRLFGKESEWGPEHMAHCLNVLREAIACLSDSSVLSFTYSVDKHVSREQASMCRSYDELRKWADDPQQAARYEQVFHDWEDEMER